MEILHQSFRAIHIAAGITAFLVAPIALIVRKGSTNHRRWGKVYYWAMIISTVISVVLSIIINNPFLFGIAIFSFYTTFTGRRVLTRKRIGQHAGATDWILTLLSVLSSLALGVYGLIIGDVLSVIFGSLFSIVMLNGFRKMLTPKKEKNAWFFNHMTGMTGSYIAALTAFSATNMNFLPMLVQWLWPTAVIVPVLSFHIAKYKRKFAKGIRPADVAEVQLALDPV